MLIGSACVSTQSREPECQRHAPASRLGGLPSASHNRLPRGNPGGADDRSRSSFRSGLA